MTTIQEIAARLAADYNLAETKNATIAARAVLLEQPTPPGLMYNEQELPAEIAKKVFDLAKQRLEQAGGRDPIAKVAAARTKVEKLEASLQAARHEYHEQIRRARSIGVPSKDIEAATGYSRGYIHEVVKGNK